MGLERLESEMALRTAETLHGRIAARFPARGLVKEDLIELLGAAQPRRQTAALCAEDSQDNVVLDTVCTVSTVEGLTVDLSGKIWQKIQVVGELREDQSASSV
ncbi:hypothetical protein ACFVJS_07440 [Nocardioides sp. NPDC057772]|uniref:hypothetical protein n=1 Tax=Nocardioides sp. NPDC057772 TaxID=3346245 RepID=UPI00366AF7E7